ncbi:hypothetical protein AMD01_00985 [Priestia koreensis]|uniref:SPOR domain-containing protein n=3 Tax=Priestia koreensis TaxID=284581 RepID=A0A0M0LH31_9BACI|nr:hypothetical protein AMD01_00985 [Priestia koreensis]
MKKELLFVASVAMVMGLAGCGSTTVYVTDESKTEASVTKEENDTSVEVTPPDESISDEDVSPPENEDEVYSEEDWTTDESVDGVSDWVDEEDAEESEWTEDEEVSEGGAAASASSDKLYRIQAGVFSDNKRAVVIQNEILQSGLEAVVTEIDGQFVVYAGAFREKANADQRVQALKDAGFDVFMKYE